MFTGVSHKYPFLTPPLKTEQVVSAVIRALESGRSQVISLPLYVNLLQSIFPILPQEIANLVRKLTGANEDMKTFKGSLSRS